MSGFCAPTLRPPLTTRTPACVTCVHVQIQTALVTKVGRIYRRIIASIPIVFQKIINSPDEDFPSYEEVEVVRGAKPYRFKLLALAPWRESEHGSGDADGVHDDADNPAAPANIARLNNADR